MGEMNHEFTGCGARCRCRFCTAIPSQSLSDVLDWRSTMVCIEHEARMITITQSHFQVLRVFIPTIFCS
jgi:hypothetical protein